MKKANLLKHAKKVLSVALAICLVAGGTNGVGKGITAYADEAAFVDSSYNTVFDNYITVDGTRLMDGDQELKFVSLNYPQATSDTHWEHENAIKTIRDMGGNVTRSYTIPVTNGGNDGRAYVTGVDANGNLTFNEDALNALDDLLDVCNRYGVRIVIPFVDHWHWVGGIDGYVWLAYGQDSAHQPSSSSFQSWAWEFYSNQTCINYFEQMIEHLMNRVNTVSGIKYKDDPAVLCWETGNELGANQSNQNTYDDVLTAWNKEIVNFTKAQGIKQLVLDGRMSTTQKSRTDNPADILGAHYYEGNYATRCADDTRVCHEAGYPFILGEFGGKVKASDCTPVFQAGLENGTNGIMMWSLRAHKDGYGYYFHDEDGYWAAYHWPGFPSGSYYGETEIIRSIYAYAQIANGKASNYEEAKQIAIPAPETEEAPLLYDITTVGDIKWRGVVGGAWYEIQRAEGVVTPETADAAEWTTIAGEAEYVYDSGRNWEDKSHDCIAGYHDETALTGQTYSYRLRACNESGVGLWSNIVTVDSAAHIVTDDLDMIAVSSNDANPTEVRNVYSYDHSANVEVSSSSVVNKSSSVGYIGYAASIPVNNVTVTTVSDVEEGNDPVIYVSRDDVTYTPLEAAKNGKAYTVTDLLAADSYYYVRVYIPGNSKCKLDAISIEYVNNGTYNESTADVKTNVMIQDNTFGEGAEPDHIYKSSNLALTEDGLTATDDAAGTLIYKTGDDINAYRVIAQTKNGAEPTVEVSFDGIEFAAAPVLSTDENGRIVYGNLDVADATRVIRITWPEGAGDDIAITSVELSSGNRSIPLAESSPANTLEDGEYYFGSDDNLQAAYTVTPSGNTVTYAKAVEAVDMTSYDSLYVWVAKDNSSSALQFSLTDANGGVFTSPAYALSSSGSEMVKFDFGQFTGNADLSAVTGFAVTVTAADTVTAGNLALSGSQLYTGNYGVALQYALADGTESAVYFDAAYVSSSSKVDDFEGYSGSSNLLNGAYNRNTNGGTFDLALDAVHKYEGSYGLKVAYNYNGTGYAGATKTMDLLNLGGYDGFVLYCESDGSGNQIKIQVETDVSTFSYTGYLTAKGPMIMYMPFEDVKEESWAGNGHILDQNSNLKSVSIYTNQEGSVTNGVLYFDDIKGANFVTDLESQTAVTLDTPDGTVVDAFPYAITGTAAYVEYVRVTIGDKSFNVPVAEDGTWSYELTAETGIKNGTDIAVQAGEYYPNGDVIAETDSRNITIAVAGNDPEEEVNYDAVWTWDFATDGIDGWVFNGFTPWLENGMLVSWSQNAYEATFSYKVENIPNGIYTLGNDIKVKSNINYAYMELEATDGTVVKSNSIDTEDVVQTGVLLGDTITVTDNTVTVVYAVGAPDDTNGSTFAAGNLALYKVGDIPEKNYIVNGDMAEANTEWPNLPTVWEASYEGGDGWSPIKGENETFAGWASAPYTFTLQQTVSDVDAGIYELSAEIREFNEECFNSLIMQVTDAQGNVIDSVDVTSQLGTEFAAFTLSNLTVEGPVTVAFIGDVKTSGAAIDNVVLRRTGDIPQTNYIVNGDMAETNTEWPNLPTSWDSAYEGGDGWSPIKGENGAFVAWASAPYTFTWSQIVTDLERGVYELNADLKQHNDNVLNSLTLTVTDAAGEVLASKDLTTALTTDVWNTYTLSDITAEGDVTVTFTADVKTSGIAIDNVALYRTGDVEKQENPFIDVEEKDWYYDAVIEIYHKGLMTGFSETTFAPKETMSRAMVATVLYRMAGSPETAYEEIFADVPSGKYYSESVTWAAKNGVVNGYGDGKFKPGTSVTREQMVKMLYNYATILGLDTSDRADLMTYSDGEKVSNYAKESMSWAVANGVLSGTVAGKLKPRSKATRAEVAQMVLNFYKLVEE